MTLAEKIRYLREVEGSLRGLNRPMRQLELVTAIRKEQGKSISQSYISQIEGGSRPHMTQSTRSLLAKFFKVHPGFLVDDPEGYHTELTSDLRTVEGKLDVWLLQGSERFAGDAFQRMIKADFHFSGAPTEMRDLEGNRQCAELLNFDPIRPAGA